MRIAIWNGTPPNSSKNGVRLPMKANVMSVIQPAYAKYRITWISRWGIGRGIALLMMASRQPKTSESGLMQARRNSAPWMVTSPWSEKSIPWCSLTVITLENPSRIAMNRAMKSPCR